MLPIYLFEFLKKSSILVILHRNLENAKVCKMECLKLFVQFILNSHKVSVLMIFSRHCCQLSHLGSLDQNMKLPTSLSRYIYLSSKSSLVFTNQLVNFFYIGIYLTYIPTFALQFSSLIKEIICTL